ncbi:Uncharacterised protein [Pragia fontium]|uniref:MvaI/BcnI family restriction endonuclease n=1 Tax=Pragia fontium TaxID=82985 RepID=UPI0006493A48|nr:MvaI/BcnI family restriction endonuclease [Pragia fontium]AKJ41512.1 hypothetical protein QQ39_04980 [Pragia fontium]SUB81776.1 Uncharacterised protein [Pragia fontium]
MSITPLEHIAESMRRQGANKIIYKLLANNDNSKQQIYMASDFSLIKEMPTGEIRSDGMSSKGPIFKSALDFFWITMDGRTAQAKHTQLILYPKYPEVRLSGFIMGCSLAPSHLMQPPTPQEREDRAGKSRCLILGICKDRILAYASAWEDEVSYQAIQLIDNNKVRPFNSIFYEYFSYQENTQSLLISKLKEIYEEGFISSRKLTSDGIMQEYKAKNGAGFTLESCFGITPNGRSEPDFMDWELKAHSGSVVTLMTPEPNMGMYCEDIYKFMDKYASNKRIDRLDFTGIHKIGELNPKTNLVLTLQGYDINKEKIIDADGGALLMNSDGDIAAGWSFSKLLEHWKRKHSRTCFVSYEKIDNSKISYKFGPRVTLAEGAELAKFFNAIANNVIYYDPGVNMKLQTNGKWKPKKRNQFRVKWSNISKIYGNIENLNLDEL